MEKKSTGYLGKGLMLSLILIVIDLIGGFSHLWLENWFKWIGALVLIIGLIILCIQYGHQKTDGVTFGNVFGYGFKVALVVSAIIMIYSLISMNLIFPEHIDQILAKSRADMEAKGNLSDEQMDQGIAMAKKFLQPLPLAIFAFLGTLIYGTIGALLGGAFTKKSEPIPKIFQDNP